MTCARLACAFSKLPALLAFSKLPAPLAFSKLPSPLSIALHSAA